MAQSTRDSSIGRMPSFRGRFMPFVTDRRLPLLMLFPVQFRCPQWCGVSIYLQISLYFYVQVKKSVSGKAVQHVVKKILRLSQYENVRFRPGLIVNLICVSFVFLSTEASLAIVCLLLVSSLLPQNVLQWSLHVQSAVQMLQTGQYPCGCP